MRRRQQSLVWCQYIFLALGLLALGYCAKSFTQAWLYQRWALPQMTKQRSYNAESVPGSAEQPKKTPSTSLGEMSPIGRLEISRVHISAVVAEGTSQRVLSRAVGHAIGTALPGQTGNVTLAAHRDTFFRHLGDVRSGDIIELNEPGHEYRYQVRFTAVVGPKDTWVLQPTRKETLTLLTCYPFHVVGPAPDRFVIRARRIAN
ncbi:MAG TPA: class D sortase [Candidatus Angelobacter sp.]